MNRLEAANAIATALQDDYSASVWEKGGLVRVYLVEVTRKSKGRTIRRDNGFVAITAAGLVDCGNLDRSVGTIESLIAGLNLAIEAEVVSRPATQASKQAVDCVDQLEDSERRVAAIEESKIDLG